MVIIVVMHNTTITHNRFQMSLTSYHWPVPHISSYLSTHTILYSNYTMLCVSSLLIALDIFFSYVRNFLCPYLVSSSFKRLFKCCFFCKAFLIHIPVPLSYHNICHLQPWTHLFYYCILTCLFSPLHSELPSTVTSAWYIVSRYLKMLITNFIYL